MIILSSDEQDELLEREDMTVHKSPYAYFASCHKGLHSSPSELVDLYYDCLRHFFS